MLDCILVNWQLTLTLFAFPARTHSQNMTILGFIGVNIILYSTQLMTLYLLLVFLLQSYQQGTREWVYLGGLADDEWQKDDKYKGMIYWRHLALRSGVSRIFPGTQFNDKYIPIAMPWFV